MPLPQRLRVAHVTLGLEVGGQEKLLLEFVRHADRRRFELLVVALGGPGKLAASLGELGCPVLALDEAPGLRPGRIARLARLFREQRIDVVHTHDDAPLVYGMPAAWWAGIPTRIHTQHHGRLPADTWRRNLLVRAASAFCQHFVCVSHDSARHVLGLGVAARRLKTVHNGIDLARFPYDGPIADGPIVTVARLSPEKDIANLLRAARLAADVLDFRLEIAGDGPCRAELELLSAELGLGERVRFLGPVGDVPALLGRAGLFVLPSRSEGVSLTILESMARGLPVVATRVGGNPEVILDEETGLLVPAQDPPALADAVIRMLKDPQRARQMGRAGRHRAEAHFDVRHMVAAYETLYAEPIPSLPRAPARPVMPALADNGDDGGQP